MKKHSQAILNHLPQGPCHMVEIGTHRGINAEAILQSHPHVHITCIDPWDSPSESYAASEPHKADVDWESVMQECQQRLSPFGDRVTMVRNRSVSIAAEWPLAFPVDLVFIDGEHTYPAVMADIEAWYQHVKPGGWLGGHDYQSRRFGVRDAVIASRLDHYVGKGNTWWHQKRPANASASVSTETAAWPGKIKPIKRDKPWLASGATDFISRYIDGIKESSSEVLPRVLEFGSGASTIWFSRRGCHVLSLEHDRRYFDEVQRKIEKQNVFMVLFENPHSVASYSSIGEFLKPDSFDVLLIDGRNRVGCFFGAIHALRPGGIVVLDNSERDKYDQIHRACAHWEAYHFRQESPDEFGFDYQGWTTSIYVK